MMNPQLASATLQFLQRVDIKFAEAPIAVAVASWLQQGMQPQPTAEAPRSGPVPGEPAAAPVDPMSTPAPPDETPVAAATTTGRARAAASKPRR